MSQSAAIPTGNAPYSDLPPIISAFFEAKARKGLSFDAIAKQIGKDEVWLAAAFYGQVRFRTLAINYRHTMNDNFPEHNMTDRYIGQI
jgi:cyanate lyase